MPRITTRRAVMIVAALYASGFIAAFGPPVRRAVGQAVTSSTIFGF